ncbi:ABC-three component system protein [Paenibacillus sp. 8b26]|uniref:ABC-three component system protein n=1 Tax=Paenibacillus sp. 8b26 TaxID=3424133 RepID=UPI003D65900D
MKNAQFHLVTNKIIEGGIVKSIAAAQTKEEVINCVTSLRNIALSAPASVKVYAEKVCWYDDETMCMLIEKIFLCDGNANSYGDGLKEEIRSKLLIPESLPFSEIYDSLLGWVHSSAMNCWRHDKPAWLSRDTFTEYFQRIITRYKLKTFVETDHSLIPLSLVDKEAQYNELFVRQLYLLALERDDDILTDSIEDYLRCKHERTRLSIQGNITKEEMDRFDQNLVERWKIIFAEFSRKYKRGQKACEDINDFGSDMGFNILVRTLDHREPLANQPTEQYYLTRGSYHRLANNNKLQIGWHPEYKMLLGQGE